MGCAASTGGAAEALLENAGCQCGVLDKYELGQTLGEGARARVLLATTRSWKERRAVKVMSVRSESAMVDARNEVTVWQAAASHASVVSLHEVFFEGCTCYMVMELCALGSVMDNLWALIEAGERECGQALRGMILGLAHCASLGIVHRDVKPENFLLCGSRSAEAGLEAEGGGASPRAVKLADFGLAVALPPGGLLHEEAGTPPYMSPQMVRRVGYDHGTDVWSLGVVAYIMFFRSFPYGQGKHTRHAMIKAIKAGKPPSFKCDVESAREPSPDGMAFVRAVLDNDARARPTALEALELPFMMRCTSDAASSCCQNSCQSSCDCLSARPFPGPTRSQSTDLSIHIGIPVGTTTTFTSVPAKQAHGSCLLPVNSKCLEVHMEPQIQKGVDAHHESSPASCLQAPDTKRSL